MGTVSNRCPNWILIVSKFKRPLIGGSWIIAGCGFGEGEQLKKSTQTQPILFKARSTVEGTGMIKLGTTFGQPFQQRFIDTWRQSIEQEANGMLIFFRVELPQILMIFWLNLEPICSYPLLSETNLDPICSYHFLPITIGDKSLQIVKRKTLYTSSSCQPMAVFPWPSPTLDVGPPFAGLARFPICARGLKRKMPSGLVRQFNGFMHDPISHR